MIRAVLSRDDLGSYLSNPKTADLERTLVPTPQRNKIIMEFDDEAQSVGSLPTKMIVPDDEIEQFFAWVASYFDTLSPITSLVDVVPASEHVERKPRINDSQLRMLIIITIIEAAVQVRRSRSRSNVALLPASLRCMSWVYTQCIARGLPPEMIASTLARWLQIRNALTGVETPFPLDYVTAFWDHVLPLFGVPIAAKTDPTLSRINAVALQAGTVTLEHWRDISPLLSRSSDVEAVLRGPRQERIAVLDETTKALLASGEKKETFSAFCGYLASRVSDGGLEIWNVVLERSANFPTMPLWYAFYCATRNGPDLMNFERSVPLRLAKEMEDEAFDIDAREFNVLNRGKGINVADIHAVNPTSIRVRLTSGVISSFLVRDSAAGQGKEDQREQPQERRFSSEQQVRSALSEARSLSDRLTFTLSRLQQTLEAANPPQPDLGLKQQQPSPHKSSKRRAKN